MINNRLLVLTVGLPRSGKSTWARKTGYPMVNPDSVRLALHGTAYNRGAEPMVWAMTRYFVVSLFEAGHDIVILDSCNYGKGFRDEWHSPKRWECAFKVFDTPMEVCIQRAEKSDRLDLIPLIDRFSVLFEPLTAEERANCLDRNQTAITMGLDRL